MTKAVLETFYLVRYALSSGEVNVVVGEECDTNPGSIIVKRWWSSYKLGRDIFRSREEAVAKADELRKKKIVSLHRQIKKLSEMDFK